MSGAISLPVGIDFGNQNCVITVTTPERVEVISNESSNRSSPTMVTFTGNRRYAGELSSQNQMQFCQETIANLKRLISLPFESEERLALQRVVPNLMPLPNGLTGVQVQVNGNPVILLPEQLIAYMLKSLAQTAKMTDANVDQFVIVVAPWWGDKQRRSMLNACRIAGLDCIALVNSTTAAAVSYAMIHRTRLPEPDAPPVPVAFVDFGDSSLDVSIALVRQGSVAIRSVACDSHLGGADFTDVFTQYLLEKVKNEYHVDPSTSPRTMLRFRQAVEKAKKTLSINSVVMFEVQSVMGVDVSFSVRREEFNEQIGHLIERIAAPIEKALELAGVKKEDLFEAQILGGCSRVAAVYQKLTDVFGRPPQKSLDLDESCALGSGYLGAMLCPRMRVNMVVGDVTPYPVELVWEGGKLELFKESELIPNVKRAKIKVERELIVTLQSNTDEIGKVKIVTNVESPVDVDIGVGVTQNGTIEVTNAVFEYDNKSQDAVVETLFCGDLTPEQLDELQHMEATLAEIDENGKKCEDARNELETLMFRAQSDIHTAAGDYISPEEKNQFQEMLTQLQIWLDETSFDTVPLEEYLGRIEHLREFVSPIFARKAEYEELESRIIPLVAQAVKARDALQADIPHSGLPEFKELLSEMNKFLEEAKEFKEKPKYEAPAVNLQELTKQVQSFKPRVDAIRRTPLAERRNQSTFERVFETDEDNDIGGDWFTRPRPSKRSRMRPFRGFGPSMFM